VFHSFLSLGLYFRLKVDREWKFDEILGAVLIWFLVTRNLLGQFAVGLGSGLRHVGVVIREFDVNGDMIAIGVSELRLNVVFWCVSARVLYLLQESFVWWYKATLCPSQIYIISLMKRRNDSRHTQNRKYAFTKHWDLT